MNIAPVIVLIVSFILIRDSSSIRSGQIDNYINNPDWLNWGLMVPFGAPYVDVNHNGTYEFITDTPGVRGAATNYLYLFN